jgi:hypothetical protein
MLSGMGLLLPGDDPDRFVERVQQGCPIVGWRGDPTMDVYVNERVGVCEVWGFDARGERYRVVRQELCAGWQHDVLRRLRDSDWQRVKPGKQRVTEEMRARERKEHAESVEWAERRAESLDKIGFYGERVSLKGLKNG